MNHRILICGALLLLTGCGSSQAATSALTDSQRVAFAADLSRLTVTTEAGTVAEQEQVALLTSIRDEVAKLNAQPGGEVIAESVVPSTDTPAAGDDQSVSQIGSDETLDDSPAADDRPALYVTYSTGYCPPCNKLKKDKEAGKFEAFRVEEKPDCEGNLGYPAIRFEEPGQPGVWTQINGYDSSTIAWLTAHLIERTPQASAVVLSKQEQDAANHLRTVHGIDPTGMTLEQMEAAHDAAHGGLPSSHHFPGYASLQTPVRIVSGRSKCPNGMCPTSQPRRGLFGRLRR